MDLRFTRTSTQFLSNGISDPFTVESGNDWLLEFRLKIGFVLRPRMTRDRIMH